MAGLMYHSYRQLIQVSKSLRTMTTAGLLSDNPLVKEMRSLQRELLGTLGIRKPSVTSLLRLIPFLSPGSVKVFHNAETGWFTEAREKPGAPPVYHHVSDEVAMSLLKGEITHELEATLMKPDEYLGE